MKHDRIDHMLPLAALAWRNFLRERRILPRSHARNMLRASALFDDGKTACARTVVTEWGTASHITPVAHWRGEGDVFTAM